MSKGPYRAAPDHDLIVRAARPEDDQPAEDAVGWDLHFGARLTFDDDQEFDDGRGLHYELSIGPDMPRGGVVIKTVTPEQIRLYAEDLRMLARRAEWRRGEPDA